MPPPNANEEASNGFLVCVLVIHLAYAACETLANTGFCNLAHATARSFTRVFLHCDLKLARERPLQFILDGLTSQISVQLFLSGIAPALKVRP